MHIELNDAFLRALEPPAHGRLELRDTLVPGLVVRVTSNSTVSGSVRALAHDGKHTRVFIGNWPAIGIKAMRDRARIVIGQLVAGRDPTAEKRAARAKRKARAAEPTVAERLAEWRKARMQARAWSDRYAAEVARLCTKHLEPKLGKRPLTETVRQDWTALIAQHREKRPATATWLYQIAAAFLTHAEAHGWIATHPLPRKGLAYIAPRRAARERILTDDELRLIWQASAALPAKPRCFVRLLILTACRRDEAGGIAFGELDLAARRWKLPAKRAKNKNSHTMPLCSLAMAELEAVLPSSEIAVSYRLLGAISGSAIRGYSSVKDRLDQAAPIPSWVFHDIRRTVRSRMSALGIPREHAEAALNHIGGRAGLVGVYDRHDYAAEIIAALTRWQRHVAFLVTEELPNAEVVPLRVA